jgi:hypothetical protein
MTYTHVLLNGTAEAVPYPKTFMRLFYFLPLP